MLVVILASTLFAVWVLQCWAVGVCHGFRSRCYLWPARETAFITRAGVSWGELSKALKAEDHMLLLLLVITTLAMMTKFKLLKTTTKTRTTGNEGLSQRD